ncbi:acetamidase/formamidase family protein [Compostimonas suwonensis]|uniref:Acetamidase/formamidase n=1 Tax=Compostimonas suwonensis TaxID=1048394 RepID=A0A2M9BUR6_9MICO|nr:acetamidase/formamidase family protein [Compostimonas suwonensis]PJJ61695.1 acetamidase/formamidase [Compostimonas suwonensis]
MATYEVPGIVNRLWTTAHEPVLTIDDGDVLAFELQEAGGGQYDDFRNGDEVPPTDLDRFYPLAGPIMINGAEPGDVVELAPLEYSTGDWGWTSILPGMGLLPDDFSEPHLHRWDLSAPGGADYKGIATIPLRPFCGVMGLTPVTDEPLSVIPPGRFGGNVDCRDLTVGTRVFLPVQTTGARLMFGDPHAAQGDGEVCLSAIEASMSGVMRVRLHKGRTIQAPQFQTAGPLRSGIDDQGYYATMGVASDLMSAAQDAVRFMIEHLAGRYGIDPVDAYLLCSVAGDLKISEVVDAPNWVVTAYLPLSIMN